MAQLHKGMYSTRHDSSVLFDLMWGQIKVRKIANQHTWYNKDGEEIGWGDLSPENAHDIARDIDLGEWFITAPYEPSKDGGDSAGADIRSVIERARFVIGRDRLYCLDPQREERHVIEGVEFTSINRMTALTIVTSA